MNKFVPSRLAVFLIIIVAFAVSAYVLSQIDRLKESSWESHAINLPGKKSDLSRREACRAKAFAGEAEIKVWQTVENDEMVLKTTEQEAYKLPVDGKNNFKLIDANSVLDKKLTASSEEDPVEIKITGYFDRCSGVPLASLDYEDGIFRPYL